MPLRHDVIVGRYELRELLGEGGMGRVYRALDRELDEEIALKLLRPEVTTSHSLAGLRREVRLARRVTHPNIARTYDLGVDGETRFITMELVRGTPLSARLAGGATMPLPELLRVAAAIVRGLAAAHEVGVVHRDLKPSNVLLGDARVVLTDFGVAYAEADRDERGLVGTPAYMAPEQVSGGTIDGRSDVYALGVLMFRALTGRLPFVGDAQAQIAARLIAEPANVRDVVPGIPASVAALVARALAATRASRIDAVTMLEGIDAVRGDFGAARIRNDQPPPTATPASLAETVLDTVVDMGASAATQAEVDALCERADAVVRVLTPDALGAIGMLERANELRPEDARIMTRLAVALCRAAVLGATPVPSAFSRAEELALRALAVDASIGDTFATIGLLRLHDCEYRAAIHAFQAARARDAAPSDARFYLGQLMTELGAVAEGMRELEAVLDSPSLGRRAHAELARVHALLGQRDEAMAHLRANETDPGVVFGLGESRLGLWWNDAACIERGRTRVIASLARKEGVGHELLGHFARIAVARGQIADPAALVAAVDRASLLRRQHAWFSQVATEVFAMAGHREEALYVLARASDTTLVDVVWLDRCIALASLRDEPAFARSRAQVALRARAIRA